MPAAPKISVPSYISTNAKRGLSHLEHAGNGLRPKTVREARLMAAGSISADKAMRMAAWFARHESDLNIDEARDYLTGASESPTAGQVAWLLWGGDLGENRLRAMDWAAATRDRQEKANDDVAKGLSNSVTEGLQRKVDEHNEKYGDVKSKRVTLRMLSGVFTRGVGAYNTNPGSVRPGVSSSDQWAYARVNAFLFAVRAGRYKSGRFDTDLLPESHPLSSRRD